MFYLQNNASIFLGLIFAGLFFYRHQAASSINFSDLITGLLTTLSLPNLLVFFYYLLVDKKLAFAMPDAPKYLIIAVMVMAYITLTEVRKPFEKDTP